ncbi:MAG: hypothetical protein A2V67_19115 [Deltaproteobacteria bacterium RBG_13_61_14]|nr:MAG: hypothetical protein A2V67_19115 [Deltaproteobacteria bacterium RBG_13_61_14]
MDKFDQLLPHLQSPIRYLGRELNAVRKDPAAAKVTFALAFPDVYEVGISHLGVRILYHVLNAQEGVACDRAYAPWTDLAAKLKEQGIPLASHEWRRPLREFDILGFSLAHELCYSNVLAILDLAGIPLLSQDRQEGRWPLVLGGGPCASNPEPLAEFFDAFLFGEGEDAVLEITAAVRAWKKAGADRGELLARLADIKGVYVPEYFEPDYREDGTIARVRPRRAGYEKVERRIVADLAAAPFPTRPLVPFAEAIHDRVVVEIARGCTRGCRFCHAGIIYRPYRERPAEQVLELLRQGLRATGYEECSLLSLSAGDYSGIEPLLSRIIREHLDQRVAVSLPSLHVQSLKTPLMRAILKVRKTGFTLAPEAATERLRRVINKPFADAELLETVEQVFAHGWKTIKLYFMVGLPTETDEDVEAIADLVQRMDQLGRGYGHPQINLSISAFVPKPHTPFQWEPQVETERLLQIQAEFRRRFRRGRIRLKWQDPRLSNLEGIFSRGDRRLARLLLQARERGFSFEGWSEKFNPPGWEQALAAAQVDPDFYTTRPRAEDEVFAWDHLDAGVSRQFLVRERRRALEEAFTEDCRISGCQESCAVCDLEVIQPRLSPPLPFPPESGPAERLPAQPDIRFRYRLRYSRRGDARFLGQLEINRLFVRAVRRAGLPMRYSQGFHPLPRLIFGPAPPVGVASEAEYLELELNQRLPAEEVGRRMQAVLPEGMPVQEAQEIPLQSPAISSMINLFEYRIEAPQGQGAEWFPREALLAFAERDKLPILQKREKGERTVDLKDRVKGMEITPEGALRLLLRAGAGPGVKPGEVVQHVFGRSEDEVKDLTITRRRAEFKESRAVRFPGQAVRMRKR